jgi:hypothetical protein
MAKKQKVKKGISMVGKTLEMPPAAFAGGSKIMLSSNKEAVVEGCRGILEYSDDRIKLNIGGGTLLFVGTNLSIDSLTVNGVVISGKFTSVEF